MTERRVGAKILIVEDNEAIGEVLRTLLEEEGFQVAIALDGAAGLESIGAQSPDLVLLDLGLPKVPGEELLRSIRARPATKQLPVVVLTAQSGRRGAVEELGVSGFIPKPFDVDEVVRAVSRVLGS